MGIFILLDLVAKTLIMTSSSLAVFYIALPELIKRFKDVENESQSINYPEPKKIIRKKEGNLIVGDFSRRSINR